ncbi:MAG: LysR family transcriptional regulator [Kofleriaceae bacterium]
MDLNRATTFVRVVETGGFTRAAEALGLPASSVSRSVSKLEADLGITLLERTTRKVSLTDAGRAFFERAREALAGLEEANALALDAAREAHGVVRIALPADLGAVTGGIFAAFTAAHPRIRIELTFTTRGAELVGDLVDLALVIGKLPDSSLVARKLGDATHRLYASPTYLAARGTPRALADLADHETILLRAIGGEARWELVGPRGVERVDVSGRLVADHLQLVIDAAIAGAGIALVPTHVGDRAIERGELVAVLPRYSAETSMHILAHAGRHLPRRVALLRDHLLEVMTGVCKAHSKA